MARNSSEVLREWGRRTGASADVFGLLATPIGHDCAGAVQFCPPERLNELCARPGGAMRYGSQFTVYSSNSNRSLIDTAARLKLSAGWVIDRAESLAAAAVDAFTAEIDNLPHDAHKHLRTEEFLDRLRIRCESVSKAAAANRLRAATPR